MGLLMAQCSAIGLARNLSALAGGDVVIALGGAWGTLREIVLARSVERPVILLGAGQEAPGGDGELHRARSEGAPPLTVPAPLTPTVSAALAGGAGTASGGARPRRRRQGSGPGRGRPPP